MLQLRPGCECCDKDLPPESTDARICSFECTSAPSAPKAFWVGAVPTAAVNWWRGPDGR